MPTPDIRSIRTSDLLASLNPDIAAELLEQAGCTEADVRPFMQAIADELDRRIPIPAPAEPTDKPA